MKSVKTINKQLWETMKPKQRQECVVLNPNLSEKFLESVWDDLYMDTKRKIISHLSTRFVIWQCKAYDPEALSRTEWILTQRELDVEDNETLWVEMEYRRKVVLINQNVPLSFIEERWDDMDAVEQEICIKHCWEVITAKFITERWADITGRIKSNLQPGIIKKAPRELLPLFLADEHNRIREIAQEALNTQVEQEAGTNDNNNTDNRDSSVVGNIGGI